MGGAAEGGGAGRAGLALVPRLLPAAFDRHAHAACWCLPPLDPPPPPLSFACLAARRDSPGGRPFFFLRFSIVFAFSFKGWGPTHDVHDPGRGEFFFYLLLCEFFFFSFACLRQTKKRVVGQGGGGAARLPPTAAANRWSTLSLSLFLVRRRPLSHPPPPPPLCSQCLPSRCARCVCVCWTWGERGADANAGGRRGGGRPCVFFLGGGECRPDGCAPALARAATPPARTAVSQCAFREGCEEKRGRGRHERRGAGTATPTSLPFVARGLVARHP